MEREDRIPAQVSGLWSQPNTFPSFLDPLLAAKALHQAIQDQENLRTDRQGAAQRADTDGPKNFLRGFWEQTCHAGDNSSEAA